MAASNLQSLLFCRIFDARLSLGLPPLSQKSALQLSPSTGQPAELTSPSSAPAPLPPIFTLCPTFLLPFPSVLAARRKSTSLCGAVARSTVLVACGCMCPRCAGRMRSLRWCCVAVLQWQLLFLSGLWLCEPCRSKTVRRNGGVDRSRTGARICDSLLLPRCSMEMHPISLTRVCNNNSQWLPFAVVNLTETLFWNSTRVVSGHSYAIQLLFSTGRLAHITQKRWRLQLSGIQWCTIAF